MKKATAKEPASRTADESFVGTIDDVSYPTSTFEDDDMDRETIRDRVLTTGRPPNGRIVSMRIVEDLSDSFSIFVRVSWRQGEYLLARREKDEAKTYKNLSAIVRRCRDIYKYDGPILVETEKRV